MTPAFDNIWLDGEKPANEVKWASEVDKYNIDEAMTFDSGRGIFAVLNIRPPVFAQEKTSTHRCNTKGGVADFIRRIIEHR